MRGSRKWFSVEAKNFEILVEGEGRRKQFFIIEKSKGGISWIRLGEGSLGTLWKGVNECCRKKAQEKWRTEWREGKRLFSLESRENKAGCFLLCEVRDEEGKKHSLIFPEGKDKKKGWENLAYKLNELGMGVKKEDKSTFQTTNIQKDRRSFADTVKSQSCRVNTIWVDAGVSGSSSSWGKLENSLVGSWKKAPDFIPMTRELESWGRAVWKLKGGVSVAFLNKDLMLFEFDFLEESNFVMERGCNFFRGGVLKLERWRPESGCVKNKNLKKEAWIRVLGLPLHLWTRETLEQIGDGCGGFLKVDEETGMGPEISWVRILVRLKEMVRPSTVNILAGSRSYELQIWWELPPWVADVYPSKMEKAEGLQKRREEDEEKGRVDEGASLGSVFTKPDWRAELTGGLSFDATDRSPRTASDCAGRYSLAQKEAPRLVLLSNTGPEGFCPAPVGSSPVHVGSSEIRPTGALLLSNGLGPSSPSHHRPNNCTPNEASSHSLQKQTPSRVNDSHTSSAEERYCHPKPLHTPFSSSSLDQVPHLEESFGHGGTNETAQASEGSESVGSQGTALTPSELPLSARPLSRELVAVEERLDLQCKDGDMDVNREFHQDGVPNCFVPASSGAAARSPRTASDLDGGSRAERMETLTVGYLSKAGPERLSPTNAGTSPLKDRKPIPTGSCSLGLGPGCPSISRSKELSSDKARIPSLLHKDRVQDPFPSSDVERYCSPIPLYSSSSSTCFDRTSHLVEPIGYGGPNDIPQTGSVGSQGIVLTPLAILPPSSLTRPQCRDIVAVEESEFQQIEDVDKDESRGKEFLAEYTESWEESCLASFSKFLGFSTSGHEEEILEFLKRFNVGRKRGKGKGGDRVTKFDREMKKLAWNVTDTIRKKNGGLGKEARVYYNSR